VIKIPYREVIPDKDIKIYDSKGNLYYSLKKGTKTFIFAESSGKLWHHFRRMVLERDNFTCVKCGSKKKGR